MELKEYVAKIKSHIKWHWIKSHQNDTSLPVILNKKEDDLEQRFRKSNKLTPQWEPLINDKGIIFHNGLPILNNNNIITDSASDHLLYYYSEKWKVPQKIYTLLIGYLFTFLSKK